MESRVARALLVALSVLGPAFGAFVLWRGEPSGPASSADGRQKRELNRTRERAVEAAPARSLSPTSASAGERAAAPDAESLTYLAETSDDPRVIAASLREILSTYSSRSSQKRKPDAALDRVLIKHVRSAEPSIAAAAFTAARIPLMTKQPSDELTAAISELAAPEQAPARRASALEALNLIRPDLRAAHVLTALEAALSANEPYIVSLALLALSQSGPSLETAPEATRTRLAERVLELAKNADPGVRGRSLAVLSEIEWLVAPEVRYDAAERHLRDMHPYVRARASDLLLHCRQPRAIHRLVDAVSDLSPARYELTGFANLDGTPGSLQHVVPGRQRVAEAALLAMLALSRTVPDAPALALTLGGRPQSDVAVRENAELARAWYRSHRDRVPRTFVPPP